LTYTKCNITGGDDLKLSTDIIIESLSKYGVISMMPEESEFQFSSVQLLTQNMAEYDPEILYLGESHQLRGLKCSELKLVCIVCIGKSEYFEKFLQKHNANIICLPEELELSDVANQLFGTFSRLNKWQHDMVVAEVSDQGCQAMVDLGREIFGDNPLVLVNSSYDIIASSIKSTENNQRLNEVLNKRYYDKDTTDQFSRMGYMRNGDKYNKPTLVYPPNFMNCAFALRTFQSEGIMHSFLALYFVSRPPTKTDFELFCHFSEWLGKYLLHKANVTHTVLPIELFMADLLSNTQKDELYVLDRARFLKLPIDANYRLCVVLWDEYSISQARYLMMRLRSGLTFPHYKIILYKNSLLLLLHSDCLSQRIMDELDENLSHLDDLLNTCRAFAGFSTIFNSLFKMNVAYKQALTAAEYGHRLSNNYGCFYYSKYYVYDMLDNYSEKFSLEDMYVQKLKLLDTSSGQENNNLALLKNYLLTERNISATARIMYMHRNSVIYRITRIQEILGVSLDDSEVRLRILLSYKILELLNGKVTENSLTDTDNQGNTICIE
jgi:sugar diacid utilization regulator